MSRETESERLRSGHNFVICCVLGVVTCANLIRRAVQVHRFITPWGWIYFGIGLLAIIVGAIHFLSLEKHFAYRRHEAAFRQLQSSTEWMYIAFNAAVFGVMHFVPFHLGR